MSASELQIDVRAALKHGLAQLPDAHVPSYTLAAELLLLLVLGRDRTWIYSHPEATTSSADADRYSALIAGRAAKAGLSVVGAQHAAPQLGTQLSAATDQSPVTSNQSPLFDLIASNPPYIGRREAATLMNEVRDHEPEIALYGGEEGYEL